jgi:hypothetical protein
MEDVMSPYLLLQNEGSSSVSSVKYTYTFSQHQRSYQVDVFKTRHNKQERQKHLRLQFLNLTHHPIFLKHTKKNILGTGSHLQVWGRGHYSDGSIRQS